MRPISLADVARATNGRVTGDPALTVDGVSTDSRNVKPGDLFFALKGDKSDGHRFVGLALQSGAAAAVVRDLWLTEAGVLPGNFVSVDDPLAALGRLGQSARRRCNIPVVGITGSVGKTTTRQMLSAMLRTSHNPLVSPANFNTEIGVPISLLDMNEGHDVAVIELAMRGPGQIAYLCEIARPTAAVITNVGVTHLELLGSRDNIASAKSELLDSLPGQGWAVLNADDDFFDYFKSRAPGPVVAFGRSDRADFRATGVAVRSDGCASFGLEMRGASVNVHLRVPGEFHVNNALGAAAAADRFGISLDAIRDALESYEGFDKRMVVKDAKGGWRVVDDTYNANPAAMAGALASLGAMQAGGRKFAVLGDMRELGPYLERGHQEVGEKVADVCPDALITVGETSRIVEDAARKSGYRGETEHFDTSAEAAGFLVSRVRPGDIILVKGSRALEMEKIVDELVR